MIHSIVGSLVKRKIFKEQDCGRICERDIQDLRLKSITDGTVTGDAHIATLVAGIIISSAEP